MGLVAGNLPLTMLVATVAPSLPCISCMPFVCAGQL